MPDFSPYGFFIYAAYGLTLLSFLAFTVLSLVRYISAARALSRADG